MAKLIVNRNSSYYNKLRDVELFVNDKFITKIKDNEDKEIDIENIGKSEIYAKIDWVKSNKVSVDFNNSNDCHKVSISSFNPKRIKFKIILSLILIFLSPFIFNQNLGFKIVCFVILAYISLDVIKYFWLLFFNKEKFLNITINNVAQPEVYK